jgi:glutaminase
VLEIDALCDILEDQLGLDPTRPDISRALAMLVDESSNSKHCDYDHFVRMMVDASNPIQRALTGKIAIPDFVDFCKEVVRIFHDVKKITDGELCNYIPELQKTSQDSFSVALCTIDGQQFAFGDTKHEFAMQGCVAPFLYLAALEEYGIAAVHKMIGREPSGGSFDAVRLNAYDKPHNPMVNTGAITLCSMLHPEMDAADRFGWMASFLQDIGGGKNCRVGFNQPVYLSEKESGDQNFALAYYMKGKGVFGSQGGNLEQFVDLYFQLCATSVTCSSLASMAATLASGGRCPLSGKQKLKTVHVKNCLSGMYSCGMFDYSGAWAFNVGLPAKSGVSGALMIIVPNLMGLVVYSPRLNRYGHSVRGIEFCKRLSKKFSLSVFDQIVAGTSRMSKSKEHTPSAKNTTT